MKSIKPITLKEAKILSNEEMKYLFGGSGGDSGVIAECKSNAECTISNGGTSYSGTCSASVSSSSISCLCKYSFGGVNLSGSDSACFKVTP